MRLNNGNVLQLAGGMQRIDVQHSRKKTNVALCLNPTLYLFRLLYHLKTPFYTGESLEDHFFLTTF